MIIEELIKEKVQIDGVKVKGVIWDTQRKSLTVSFYICNEIEETVKTKIFRVLKEQVSDFIDYINLDFVSYNKTPAGILNILDRFLNENFPIYTEKVNCDNTRIEEDDGRVLISIDTCDVYKDYITNNNVEFKINEFLKGLLNCNVDAKFFYCESKEWLERIESQKNSSFDSSSYENVYGIDTYPVKNVTAVIGKGIHERATLISSIFVEEKNFTFAGVITDLDILVSKAGKDYVKFTLTDMTSSINCMYFAKERKLTKKELKKLDEGDETITKSDKGSFEYLKNGATVIVKGRIKRDVKNNSYFSFLTSVSFCELPSDDVVKKITNKKPYSTFKAVFPSPYIETEQVNLFGNNKIVVSGNAKNGTYVAFDLETTGLDATSDMIIEFGAVKIVDGVITEIFSSFVNPQIPIPERITELTGITDKDVEDAPKIDEVMPDFFKFCFGFPLIAHNIDFDYKFISCHGQKLGYYFLQERIDTLALAREKVKGLRNYKLNTVAEHLNCGDFNHHRAFDDAKTCANIFLQLY